APVVGGIAGEEHESGGIGGAGQQHDRTDPQSVPIDEGGELEMPFRPPLIVAELLSRESDEDGGQKGDDGYERRGEEEHREVELAGKDHPHIEPNRRRQCRSGTEVARALPPPSSWDDALYICQDRCYNVPVVDNIVIPTSAR